MRLAWSTFAWQLIAVFFFVCVPAWTLGGRDAVPSAAALGLLALLAWHLFQLGRLIRWLGGPLDAPLPVGGGVWEIAFSGLHRRARIRSGQQQALADALERFTRAAQALPDGIIVYNRHCRIDWLNARAEAHFSLSGGDRGQALTNLIRHPDFVTYLQHGDYHEPLLLRGGRGDAQTLLLQIIPYGDDQTLLLSRDVTQIERLERMRSDFIANVSHELKTPLTVVSGFAEMLADDPAGYSADELRRYLKLINEQSVRMRCLIDDLLTLSALETGSEAPVEERVEMRPLLEAIYAETQALSGGRHRLSLTFDGPVAVRGCAGELRSALGNLASNAVRYTPEGGSIDLLWHGIDNGAAEFLVSDTGIGVAPQHIPRLTERFYRVDRSRSRETGGTGLGLAIVKHVLTRHQGTLEIDSELGRGSRFAARFPVHRLIS
ncbi:phosphate regulon sensor histidine kinase PhoR [Rhodocyclus tenuis]|uniref:Phosphate regulon sensor protein PhoR n=1 Tax=Rhodocyclus gracilis TaxID=2929842 RepID=A0ABX0WFK7_9RHOO|nr:phosphate regulon sensor histidine kinase PhoR [Rhodocyclus gracilis]